METVEFLSEHERNEEERISKNEVERRRLNKKSKHVLTRRLPLLKSALLILMANH